MRLIAEFTPQAWINDHAVTCDAQGESRWDVTAHLRGLAPAQRRATMESNSDASDTLRALSHAPEWVRTWSGPFYVSVEAEPDTDLDRALLALIDAQDVFEWEEAGSDAHGVRFRHRDSGEVLVATPRAEVPAH